MKYWAHSCSQSIKYSENTQQENMCDIVFEKAKSRGGTVNRTSVYAEGAVRKGSLKKVLWEISQNS